MLSDRIPLIIEFRRLIVHCGPIAQVLRMRLLPSRIALKALHNSDKGAFGSVKRTQQADELHRPKLFVAFSLCGGTSLLS